MTLRCPICKITITYAKITAVYYKRSQCFVCLSSNDLFSIECGHTFHKKCVSKSFDELIVQRELNVSKKKLLSLPEAPDTLFSLKCSINDLTSLPVLSNVLKILICDDNKISSLPQLPSSLRELECDRNILTKLPPLPNNLKVLTCDHNKLTELPPLPNTLKVLQCDHNILTKLPQLPNNLKVLYCSYNKLSLLPQLPNKLRRLHCYSNNKLTTLPELPGSLEFLECNRDKFTYIPHYLLQSPHSKYKISIINRIYRFRLVYYRGKYGNRLFYAILKKRMDIHRNELITKANEIKYRPELISNLLLQHGITINNTDVLNKLLDY